MKVLVLLQFLLFTFAGISHAQTDSGKNVATPRMTIDTQALGEVVVVGYGTRQKKDLTTAISSVKGAEINALPTMSAGQAIVGKVPGISLQQGSGGPGAAPIIRIRGSGSITSGNNPLYVIDGYPTADGDLFNAISPTDIESIDILKDAAAAAIYGSRAGNGVIVVSTRKGRAGQAKLTFDATLGQNQVTKKYDVLNPQQFISMASDWYANQHQPLPAVFTDPSLQTPTDWQDAIFRKALYSNYQLGASGGSDKVNYALSGGYTKEDGIIKRTGLERYNFHLNVNANVSKRLKAGANILALYSVRQDQPLGGPNNQSDIAGILGEALALPPIVPVYQSNGDYLVIPRDSALVKVFNTQIYNPVNKIDANNEFTKSVRLLGSAFLEYEVIKGLKLRSTLNIGANSERYEQYVAPFVSFRSNDAGNISTPNLSAIRASRSNNSYTNIYLSNTASYDVDLSPDHHLNALLGYDVARQSDYGIRLDPRTDKDNPVAFDNPNITNVQGAVLNQGSSFNTGYTFDAIFSRLEYSYRNKYYATGSLRRDRSSLFGPENRAGVFPSVSLAWRLANEPFIQALSFISDFKVRASYGETGNDQLSSYYPWLGTMNRVNYVFGKTDARVIGYYPGGFTNAGLKWEKNRQVDFGLNLGLFQDRVYLTADVYERNSNAILSAAIPSVNGIAQSYIDNVGNIRNRGLELAIDTRNLTGDLKWNTNFNISFNKNQIVRLGPNQTQLTNLSAGGGYPGDWLNVIRNYLGRPMGDIYMYKVAGVFKNESEVNTLPKLGTQGVGDLRFEDVNGDKKITPDDMTYVGNYQPDFIYGMTNTFSYKDFDLNIVLQGSQGGKMVNAFERMLTSFRQLDNSTTAALNRFRSEEEPGDGKTPIAGSSNVGSNINPNTRYLYSTSFLRVRTLSLGYRLPLTLSRQLHIEKARVFIIGQNLFTFTNYPGFNPEANFYGDSAVQNGVDLGTYPISKSISIGLNLTF